MKQFVVGCVGRLCVFVPGRRKIAEFKNARRRTPSSPGGTLSHKLCMRCRRMTMSLRTVVSMSSFMTLATYRWEANYVSVNRKHIQVDLVRYKTCSLFTKISSGPCRTFLLTKSSTKSCVPSASTRLCFLTNFK